MGSQRKHIKTERNKANKMPNSIDIYKYHILRKASIYKM